jgi:hypothetical protein
MAAESKELVQERLAEALDRLRELGQTVEDLSRRIGSLERMAARPSVVSPCPIVQGEATTIAAASSAPEPSWLGRSRVLQRAATVCFVLVGALVLRTLHESGVLGEGAGVVLGVVYCAMLVAVGWRQLAHDRPGQHVLPVCGAVLLGAILLEAYGRQQLLAASSASWMLLVMLVAVSAVGLRFASGSIVAFATLSASVSALALGFPELDFPHTAAVLLAASVAAHLALRITGMQWLSWVVLALTVFFWVTWSIVDAGVVDAADAALVASSSAWFLPWLAVFALVLFVLPLHRARRRANARAFHVFSPVANVVWVYGAALTYVTVHELPTSRLGAAATMGAAVHFAAARYLWRLAGVGSAPLTAFATGGALLFALGLPALVGGVAGALPAWSLLALALVWSATRAGSSGLRVTSYILQLVTCGAAVVTGSFSVPPTALAPTAGVALFVAVIAASHYRLAKRCPPAADTWLARADATDHAPIVTLWVSAIAAFACLRLLLHSGLPVLGAADENTFEGLQSVIVNCAGAALLLLGARRHDEELLATGAIVGLIGGLIVFGVNLLSGHGVPLVLAVLSFGMAAAAGSLALRKWQGAANATVDGAHPAP